MDIVFLTTEAVPFAKTGGLADVCGALPICLAERGHHCAVIMPAFRQIHGAGLPVEVTDTLVSVQFPHRSVSGRVLKSSLPDSNVSVYFIDQPQYFDRPALYGDHSGDYQDNCERFAFYSRSALQVITRLGLQPDILHCNDWQAGLVPAYLRAEYQSHPWMTSTASVMTVHNLAYQGRFWHGDMGLTDLDWAYFNPAGMEFYGQLNLLKTGLVFADMLSTVSPQYAKEIQTAEHGCGLDGILQGRQQDLVGIINGVDGIHWNPATDTALRQTYDVHDWSHGKRINRAALRETFGLVDDPHVPVIGLVGRLADQKGWDIVIEAMRRFMEEDRPLQWVVLGTGEPRYHESLQQLAHQFPHRLGLKLGFSNELAHQIEAGADMFLMPSRYEPCGLNQLYSLRYGTVPLVNPTGGLADTVVDLSDSTLQQGTATGFYLRDYSTSGLLDLIWRAALVWWDEKDVWGKLVEQGMQQDWSWNRSAEVYERLYATAISRKKARLASPPPRPPRR